MATRAKKPLLDWVDAQRGLSTRDKFVLQKAASFTDDDCLAWFKVDTVAQQTNGSKRATQYALRRLEDAGLIMQSGRTHRLSGTTRSVPIYIVAPYERRFGEPTRLRLTNQDADGCRSEPVLTGHGCKTEDRMGATGCARIEPMEPIVSANALTQRGRDDLRRLFEEIERAVPQRMLGAGSREGAFEAFLGLVDDGVEVASLADCARRMAADPLFQTRRIPPMLEDWLRNRWYRAYLPVSDAERDAPAARTRARSDATTTIAGDFFPDADVREHVAAIKGEAFAVSYLDRSRWDPVARKITAWCHPAWKKLSELKHDFAELSVTLNEYQD